MELLLSAVKMISCILDPASVNGVENGILLYIIVKPWRKMYCLQCSML